MKFCSLRTLPLVLSLLLLSTHVAATPIVPFGLQSAAAQSTFADLAVASVISDFGADPGSAVAYDGTTAGTLWSGDFLGEVAGLDVNGSMSGDITAPSPGDPTITLQMGSLNIGPGTGTAYSLSGSFTVDDNNAVTSLGFTMSRTVGGVTTTRTWKDDSGLTWTTDANGNYILKGSVKQTGNAGGNGTFAINMTFTAVNPFLVPTPYAITSTLGQNVKNSGKVTVTSPTSFDGDTDLVVEPTPEPSSLALISIGMLGLFVSRYRKRLSVRHD